MGGRRYTQEDRDRALGALMGSATLEDGEWKPEFQPTAKAIGVPRDTLRRWWRTRDRADDAQLRASRARAREEAQVEGAVVCLADRVRWLQAKADALANQEWELDADRAARALLTLAEVNERLGRTIAPDVQAPTVGPDVQAYRRWARQMGLVADEEGES